MGSEQGPSPALAVAGRRVPAQGHAGHGPLGGKMPFLVALLAGGGFWLLLGLTTSLTPLPWCQVASWPFLSLVLWQPVVEEILFRGILQGLFLRFPWGKRSLWGISVANVLTSLLFVFGHGWQHPWEWAVAVFFPSLLFGWFRDVYARITPAVVLHMVYNAGYFLLTGVPI
ncbi:MAG: hypothetical protein KatS3mg131_0429 [Candidatus Tectimicrobiota bacterium]|nr:MAG: hypothetical protein KatS3mg131_0429 [Candidatus Tectomicrobia bacterium]